MPRSRGRGSFSSSPTARARSAPRRRFDEFDDVWLRRLRERFDARFVDLQNWRHRARWNPAKPWGPNYQFQPFSGRFRPRILVVPEGHRLARLQTYGGRYSLRAIREGWKVRRRSLPHYWRSLQPHQWPYGAVRAWTRGEEVARKVGWANPWQIVVCVRRRRRREVMHALRIAGKKGVGAGKPRRVSADSNVRC